MSTVKMNLSLDAAIVDLLRQYAAQEGRTMSGLLGELIRDYHRRRLDEAACEGYRQLSHDTETFAADALPLAVETWPLWEEAPAPRSSRKRKKQGHDAKAR